jgi:hypothetical protein
MKKGRVRQELGGKLFVFVTFKIILNANYMEIES